MTARELGRAVGHDDAWISGILKGSQGLHWKDFDAVADKLGLSPSELIRYDDAEMRELSPSEMRLLRHYQDWPTIIRDKWLDLLDHFHATMPDKDTAAMLERLRATPRSLRRPILAWIFRLLEEGIPPEVATGGVELGSNEVSTEPGTTHPSPAGQTPGDSRKQSADRKTTSGHTSTKARFRGLKKVK